MPEKTPYFKGEVFESRANIGKKAQGFAQLKGCCFIIYIGFVVL